MILVAIPAKSQEQYLDEMIAAIDAMSVKPDKVLYMQDRPTGQERVAALRKLKNHPVIEPFPISDRPPYVGRPQMVLGVPQFMTGYVRERAIAYMMANGYDQILFFDGDCIPEPDLVKDHVACLSCSSPAVTVGMRKESMYGWTDQRTTETSHAHIFFGQPTPVTEEYMFVDSGVVWTCNFGMNRAAIDILIDTNKKIYGRAEVFPSDFLGTWGGEDGFVGLECFYRGIDVVALPIGNNGIRHKCHPRPERKYQHTAFIPNLESHREELLYLLDSYGLNVRGIKYIDRYTMLTDIYNT